MPKAAMERRNNVKEIAEASVAYLMKMALEPKETEARSSATIPLDGNSRASPESTSRKSLLSL